MVFKIAYNLWKKILKLNRQIKKNLIIGSFFWWFKHTNPAYNKISSYTHVESFIFFPAGICMDVQTPIFLLAIFVHIYKHSIIQKKPLYVCTSLRFSPASLCMFAQSSAGPFLAFGSLLKAPFSAISPYGSALATCFCKFEGLGVCSRMEI